MSEQKKFNDLIETLQRKIEEEEKKIYSKKVIEEYSNPTNFGFIKNPDSTGEIKGPCKDTMRFDLKIINERISEIRFWTDGCGASIACGNKLSKMVKGLTLKEADKITSSQLVSTLDGLPEDHKHCSILAVDTLRLSIKNFEERKNESA